MNALPPDFAVLPLAEQRACIERVAPTGELAALLAATAALRDPAPLSLALSVAGAAGRWAGSADREALAAVLPTLGDVALDRALEALTPHADVVAPVVEAAARALPMDRLVATAVVARWLRRHAPVAAARLADEAVAAVEAAVTAGRADALDDATLAAMPGRALAALRPAAWRDRRARFAARALEVLGDRPKSLSQASAEQLLGRRIYTNPAHCLAELLQNAVDAGATTWRVEVRADALWVWHDGAPFDARDVVGLLSIGQTTKIGNQIGTFGVGFKSVYAICDRPQVYSDVYAFEIADVSLPRPLGGRPAGAPEDGTLLVLPLRAPEDADAGAAALWARLLAIPDEVLLTLPGLSCLQRRRGRTVVDVERRAMEGDVVRLERSGGAARAYRMAGDGDVRVALALDDAGAPMPLPESVPPVFAFLPTDERPGWQVLVQARFDLPVDRERVDLAGAQTRGALGTAGRLLAGLVASSGEAHRAAALRVVPTGAQLTRSGWRPLADACAAALRDAPVVACADGLWRRPNDARRVDDAGLAEALARAPLDAAGRRAAHAGDARLDAVWAWLDTPTLDDATLRALVAEAVEAPSPAWLPAAWPALLRAVARLDDLGDLRRAPVVPDATGRARRPEDVWLCAPAERSVALRPLVAAALEGDAALAGLWSRLGVRRLTPDDVADDLVADAEASAAPSDADVEAGDRSVGAKAAATGPAPDAGASAPRSSVGADAGLSDPPVGANPSNAPVGAKGSAPAAGVSGAPPDRDRDAPTPPLDAGVAPPTPPLDAVLSWLDAQPPSRAARVAAAPRFPDAQGRPRPLTGPDALRLTPAGALGALVRSAVGGPPRPAAHVEARWGAVLARLGARSITLVEVVEGADEAAPAWWEALHAVLATAHGELSGRDAARVAGAPIFLCRDGARRPVRGSERARVPSHEALVSLCPEVPWLEAGQGDAPHVRALGEALAFGARDLVAVLAAAPDDARVEARLDWLATHADGIGPAERGALMAAPVWSDTDGRRATLDALRAPPEAPALAAALAAWPLWRTADGPTVRRAAALGLPLAAGDAEAWVAALETAPDDALGAAMQAHRDVLVAALRVVVEALAPSRLVPLMDARLWRDAAGEAAALGAWSRPHAEDRVYRAVAPFRAALAGGPRRLLHPDDEVALGPLLDALGVRPAGPEALAAALDAAGSEARHAARRALATAADATRRAFAPADPTLSALPVWPARDGALRAARELLATLEGPLAAAGVPDAEVLDPAAEAEAAALGDRLAFRDPAAAVRARVRDEAKVGASLVAQPPWLSDVPAVLAALAVAGASEGLPLAVDAAGRLAAPPLFDADDDARAMLAGLPLAARLADPTWAEGARAIDAGLAPPLDVRRAALALAEAAGEAGPLGVVSAGPRDVARPGDAGRVGGSAGEAAIIGVDGAGQAPVGVPSSGAPAGGAERAVGAAAGGSLSGASAPLAPFSEPARRGALYRWWARHAGEIEADEHARGALGKAALIETAGGWLRAPRELVLDPDVPDLGLDLEPSPRVPAALVEHLRRAWRLDRARLAAVVEPLLEAHRAAEQVEDGERSAELLAGLAGLVGDGLDEAAARFKLRKRLRAEADDGTWLRPKALLVTPDGAEADAVAGFLSDPPRQAHARYGPRARAVLVAAGAAAALDEGRLAAALEGQGRRAGADADRAFAGYLAVRVAAEPALARRLRLDARDWVPTVGGGTAAPRTLFWPDAEVRAVLGAGAPLPDAASVPALAGARAHLAFRTLDEAGPEGVVAGLPVGEAAPAAALDWLEGALEAHRTTARAVREAWGDRAALAADDGRVLPPSRVCVEVPAGLLGGRRGTWSEGRSRPRLAAALGVPRRPDGATLQAVLGEVAADVERSGGDALARAEPALLDALPRMLEALAEAGGRPPARWALAVQDAAGRLTLRRAGDAAVALPRPAEAVSDARGRLFPWTGEADPEALLEALADWGLPDLLGRVRAVERARAEAADARRVRSAGRGASGRGGEEDRRRDLGGTSGDGDAAPRGRDLGGTSRGQEGGAAEVDHADDDDDHGERGGRRDLGGTSAGDDERRESAGASGGLWSRVKRLFGSEDDDDHDHDHDHDHDVEASRRAPSPRGAGAAPPPDRRGRRDTTDGTPQGGDWFRPRDTIESQLGGGPSDLLDRHRPALFGLAFAPGRLPPPYLYGVQVLADRFDPAGQRWTPVAVDAAWAAPPPGRGARVHLRGTLPGGVSTVPLPLYARVLDLQAPAARVPAAGGALLLRHPEPFDLDLTVELPPAPRFEDATIATAAPAALRRATVPDDELPGEALEAVDAAAGLPPLQRALALRDFVRRRYRYDPTYIEDPAVARWLRGVTRGRAHVHVAALHAGRDARHLGRGVCYELASVACELLRRADLPAAVATGWTFDRGQVDLPDHMWVMVLLETADGPRWLPLDPSTTQDGRPLHVGPRPPGPWRPRAPKQPRPLPRRPDWAESGPAPGRSAGPPVPELLAVARYLERLTGETITDDAALRRRCRALLADEEAAKAFAAWLRGD